MIRPYLRVARPDGFSGRAEAAVRTRIIGATGSTRMTTQQMTDDSAPPRQQQQQQGAEPARPAPVRPGPAHPAAAEAARPAPQQMQAPAARFTDWAAI
ncbi:MAG: hypothetical protein H5U17_13530 [Defluviimonas sp.]|nr:hypothetical protein [Defluviimonas sp.]